MNDRYEPATFESKWRERWQSEQLFKTRQEAGRPKFYGLDFFPYPSGAGLSVGHARNYVPTDVVCRMKYMQGYNVLHPMGFDSFGLPAENEAIKNQTHPAPMIEKYAARYRQQMELIAIGFDWSRSFSSADPRYYKWTQWIFEKLYEKGLAYRKDAAVWWDPVDKTVLADEEVIAGRAERSGALVEKKFIPQWFFKITDYAQRLIDDLDTIDWPDGIKSMQRNWIGRSEGCQFTLKIANGAEEIPVYDLNEDSDPIKLLSFDVFTTRVDTIFGMTFCVLAPEHPLVAQLPVNDQDRASISAYQEHARTLSDTDRTATNRPKTGVFTGAYAVNPANGAHVPIWLADYVLATYGTGAIMAVPGHDQRDFDFAVEFGLEVVPVIRPGEEYFNSFENGSLDDYLAQPKNYSPVFEAKDGTLLNSGEYDGQSVSDAQQSLGIWIEANGIGLRKIQYKLRDWLISRQRYWGCPIPIIHGAEGEVQLVSEDLLPVLLPEVANYEPSGDGSSPLAHIPEFVNTTDRDGRLGRRETDTMGGFACSSWYFLRFCDPHNDEQAWDPEAVNYWMPVDCYVGGAEHAVMHLLYARFWTKVLFDLGLVTVNEPFKALHNQGQVLGYTPYRKPREDERLEVGEEGILLKFDQVKDFPEDDVTWKYVRMSKSKGNVVTPEDAVETFGADALRMYLLFVAPFNADVEWKNEGMGGMVRFLSRIFKFCSEIAPAYDLNWKDQIAFSEPTDLSRKIRRITHQTIRNCSQDIERFGFNTYVSWMMKAVNGYNDLKLKAPLALETSELLALSEAVDSLILVLSPGAPHSADEIWASLGNQGSTYQQEWPTFNDELAAEDTITIAVQVNGKLRDTIEVPAGTDKAALEATAMASSKVQGYLEGNTVRKVIVVEGRLVNIVAN